jgi:hypothetical protein
MVRTGCVFRRRLRKSFVTHLFRLLGGATSYFIVGGTLALCVVQSRVHGLLTPHTAGAILRGTASEVTADESIVQQRRDVSRFPEVCGVWTPILSQYANSFAPTCNKPLHGTRLCLYHASRHKPSSDKRCLRIIHFNKSKKRDFPSCPLHTQVTEKNSNCGRCMYHRCVGYSG